jgi:hypothetical protein
MATHRCLFLLDEDASSLQMRFAQSSDRFTMEGSSRWLPIDDYAATIRPTA